MSCKQPTFIDLFSGLGGFHVGLRRLGYRCVLSCEKDPVLRELYSLNFGTTPVPDVRRLPASAIPRHDILCAGFPCQPFSKAGEQLGLECNRDGDLFEHIIRILRRCRPQQFILENVANLLRHNQGETFRWMQSQLMQLGYDVSHAVLSPHDFGIPQIRARAFIVGSRGGLNGFCWPARTETEPNIRSVLDRDPADAKPLPANYRECLDVWQDFLDRIPSTAAIPSFPIWSTEFGATYPVDGPSPARCAAKKLSQYRGAFGSALKGHRHAEQLGLLPSYARGDPRFPSWKKAFILQNRSFFAEHGSRLKTWIPRIKAFAASLQKLEWNCRGERRDLNEHILQFRASGVRIKRANWAPAIVAMTTTQIPVIAWEHRYMTVIECARLQGLGDLHLSSLPASKAYRAIGNAVSADVVQLIALALTSSQNSHRSRHITA